MVDLVNHPPHYSAHPSGVEVIELTEHLPFCLGNAVKYVLRHRHKGNPVQDLEKALWYLNRQRGALTVSLIRVPRVAILAAKKVVDNEGDPNLVGFLNAIFHEDASGTGALYWGDLGVAIAYVENMRYAALGVTP